jgi:hypothetical protein
MPEVPMGFHLPEEAVLPRVWHVDNPDFDKLADASQYADRAGTNAGKLQNNRC